MILDRKQKNVLYWFSPDEIMDIKIVQEGFKVLYKREQNDYVSFFFSTIIGDCVGIKAFKRGARPDSGQ